MKIIFIIIIVILAGLLFGFLLVKFFLKFSNWILGRRTRKDILRKDLSEEELKRRNFFFRNKAYNLTEMVEYDLNKRVKFKDKIKKLFNRSKKGVSQYGESNAGNPGFKREQVSAIREGNSSPTTSPTTDTARTTAEQPSINPTETREQQRVINRGLFEERTKNHRLLL
jgi:hypothetical protein